MNILVIKQTSLGDVLHSTGHVRALKERFPESHVTLVTATSSADIYRHSAYVDELIMFDRYRVKRELFKHPLWCFRHIREVMQQIRRKHYAMAFDLQGLARTVVFLYLAKAGKKFVKGRWLGLSGFRDKSLHAIREMDGVLALAGITEYDTEMEIATSAENEQSVEKLLEKINPGSLPLVILSPFSRWQSKDWPLQNFADVAERLSKDYQLIFTGAADRQEEIESLISRIDSKANITSLAGKINLLEFAALVKRATVMLTGDSFPMHIAGACNTAVVALFAPTDEKKVGPTRASAEVIRASDCLQCDRRTCKRACLSRISVEQAVEAVISKIPAN